MSGRDKPAPGLRRFLFRLALVLVTLVLALCLGAWILLRQVFCGPSPAARDLLAASMLEREGLSWIPGLFLDEAQLQALRLSDQSAGTAQTTDPSRITVSPDPALWASCPEGIRRESIQRDSFAAHLLRIRDPERLFLSHTPGGNSIAAQILKENAQAGIYASAGSSLLVTRGEILCDAPVTGGFAGFNRENVLILAGGMTEEEAAALDLRDGCACGMILLSNGQINEGAYNANSGYAPRVCMGQREDGTVVLLTIDGLTTGSVGGTYRDCIDILFEYGCVNACCLEDVPAAMLLDGTMLHGESVPRAEIAVLPDFWMVRPGKGE